MDIQYRKASIEGLEFLTEIRIRVLRAANGLAEDMDLSEVKRQRYQYLWKDIVSQSNFDIVLCMGILPKEEIVAEGMQMSEIYNTNIPVCCIVEK